MVFVGTGKVYDAGKLPYNVKIIKKLEYTSVCFLFVIPFPSSSWPSAYAVQDPPLPLMPHQTPILLLTWAYGILRCALLQSHPCDHGTKEVFYFIPFILSSRFLWKKTFCYLARLLLSGKYFDWIKTTWLQMMPHIFANICHFICKYSVGKWYKC